MRIFGSFFELHKLIRKKQTNYVNTVTLSAIDNWPLRLKARNQKKIIAVLTRRAISLNWYQ